MTTKRQLTSGELVSRRLLPRRPERLGRLGLVALTAAASLVLAACNDSNSGGSTESGDDTSAGLSGPPVKFVQIATVGLGVGTAEDFNAQIKVVEKIINDAGGIQGRPVSISLCQTSTDQSQATQCALDAAQDDDVVGVLATQSNFGAAVMPALEEAGLASVGTVNLTPADYQSPISFPVAPGGTGNVGAAAALCVKNLDESNVGLAVIDVPAGPAVADIAKTNILTPAGATVTEVSTPATATDVSAQVAKLAKTDCIVSINGDATSFLLYKGLQQVGYKGAIVTTGTTLADAVANVGDNPERFYSVQPFNFDSEGWATYLKELDAAGADDSTNAFSQSHPYFYLAAKIAAQVLNSSTDISRASLLDGMNTLSNYDTHGMTGEPLDFTQKLSDPYNRMFNPYVFGVQLKDSKWAVEPTAINGITY